ncbi:succinate dehydrogenase assembly factor 4, mitochondrial-like [Diadema antillarum]|uniref:succinate dehydrogenase assembly factor 4, mitochondrial-like n=1 Tax=Diadema antillarum TaxID=105358 RepID=UPI003A8B5883
MASSLLRARLGLHCCASVARRALFTTPARCASTSGNQGNGDQQPPGKAPLKKAFTPTGKHDTQMPERHRDAEKEPLQPFPDDVNPVTGEKGGPRGPEPTRYGDWERKGRCIDF